MKRRLFCILTVLCLALAACAPAAPASSEPAQVRSISFTDDLGRTVTVEPPQRVAALIGSFADIWQLSGGEDTLVAAADDAWTSFDLNLDENVVHLGGVKQINLEQLAAAQPDLVLASSNTAAQLDLLPALEQLGLNVAYFKVAEFEDYLHMLDLCTQLTGDTERFDQYGLAVESQVQAARDRADGSAPTVLYIRATGAGCKVKNSRDSVLGEMLRDLGCVNIADSDDSLLEQLSLERILQLDPEYIFVVMQGADKTGAQQALDQTLLASPAWQSLTAVRQGRYYVMDDRLYNLKPNARWGEAYERLADILYPDSVPDAADAAASGGADRSGGAA